MFVYRAAASELTEAGEPPISLPALKHGRYVDAEAVRPLHDAGRLTIVDFAVPLSGQSPRNVPEGAWYATRDVLPATVAKLPGNEAVLFVSADRVEAAWAANDIAPESDRDLLVLRGGRRAWEAVGLPVIDAEHPHSLDPDGPPNKRLAIEERKTFFMDYLAWGDTVLDRIGADGTLELGARP